MGLNVNYFYSLTPRQFHNIHKGYNDKREAESNERLLLTRKLMFSTLLPWSKNLTEQDIWKFDWEQTALKNRLGLDVKEIEQDIEATKKYWEDIDKRKNQATK